MQICKIAAKGSSLDVLMWLRTQGCLMDRRTWKAACRNDRKRVMEWLRSEEVRCPGSDFVCVTVLAGR